MSNADRRARKQANKAQAREERHAAWRRARRRRLLTQVLAIGVVVGMVATVLTLFFGDDDADVVDASDTTETTGPTETTEAGPTTTTALPAELAGVECTDDGPEGDPDPQSFGAAEQVIEPGVTYRVTMVTSCGEMVFDLDPSDPEVSEAGVNNFVFLARQGFYDGLTFHRVVGDFVIQGGDPDGTGSGGPGYDFGGPDDVSSDLTYELGDLAYANSTGPETSGSQFFVITGPNGTTLPPNYIKFGTIVEGLEVAQRLERFEVPGTQTPSRPLHVFSVTIEEV